jgi:hypothetical protein
MSTLKSYKLYKNEFSELAIAYIKGLVCGTSPAYNKYREIETDNKNTLTILIHEETKVIIDSLMFLSDIQVAELIYSNN